LASSIQPSTSGNAAISAIRSVVLIFSLLYGLGG